MKYSGSRQERWRTCVARLSVRSQPRIHYVMWFMLGDKVGGYDAAMKSNVLAALLTVSLFAGLGYLLLHENAPPSRLAGIGSNPPADGSLTRGPEPKRLPAPQSAILPDPHDRGLYRCNGNGRVTYQDTPCANGSQEVLQGGTVSVVPRQSTEVLARTPTASGGRVAMVSRDEPPAEHLECRRLRRQIREIDRAARQRSAEWLTAERKRVGKRLSALGCSEREQGDG